MENNITDALIMAGSVLIFVMGLSISMLAFSQARESIDILLSYSDRESLTIEDDPQFYYKASEQDTERYVGKETIIPAIYRAYKENYKIIFQFPDDYYLFKRRMTNRQEPINRIDLGEQHNNSTGSSESLISIGSDLDSRYFVEGILYQKFNLLGVSKNKQDTIANTKQKINPLFIKFLILSSIELNKLDNLSFIKTQSFQNKLMYIKIFLYKYRLT